MTRSHPVVTVTYAQSLYGCLAAEPGQGLALSGAESLRLTHQLRAAHDAILVGLGTVLADDPQLTVRYADGPNPQPILLDSQLRCPLDANLLRHPTHPLWIATTAEAPAEPQLRLEAAGAQVIRLPADDRGRVHLPALLEVLGTRGVRSLMVEGGAKVITSFLAAHLADRLIITIAPRLLGGVRAIGAPMDIALQNVHYRILGQDMIVEAAIVDGRPAADGETPPSTARHPSA